jgi:hypothetical protein
MAPEYDVVDVFVGTFGSQENLHQYLEETYDEDDEDAPVSLFARDLGQSYYDHDLIEASFRELTNDFNELSEGLSFAEYWFLSAQKAFDAARITAIDTVILAFGETIDEPQAITGSGYQLHYLGRFQRTS